MRITTTLLAILACTMILTPACKKDKTKNPIDQLPPETQTGAKTFGCLVNGEVFLPGGAQLSGGSLNAIYQYIIPGSASGYTFAVGAKNFRNHCLLKAVGFRFDSVLINTGIYELGITKNGHGFGSYFEIPCGQPVVEYLTNSIVTGQLHLKKFDLVNQIASGTFWLNAVNEQGDTVKVTDGRFDVRFTL